MPAEPICEKLEWLAAAGTPLYPTCLNHKWPSIYKFEDVSEFGIGAVTPLSCGFLASASAPWAVTPLNHGSPCPCPPRPNAFFKKAIGQGSKLALSVGQSFRHVKTQKSCGATQVSQPKVYTTSKGFQNGATQVENCQSTCHGDARCHIDNIEIT